MRLADALSLATALMTGAELVTLDQRLRRVTRSEQETEQSNAACPRPAPHAPMTCYRLAKWMCLLVASSPDALVVSAQAWPLNRSSVRPLHCAAPKR